MGGPYASAQAIASSVRRERDGRAFEASVVALDSN